MQPSYTILTAAICAAFASAQAQTAADTSSDTRTVPANSVTTKKSATAP
jgi:hypothetical protein